MRDYQWNILGFQNSDGRVSPRNIKEFYNWSHRGKNMVFWSQYKVFSYLIDMVKGSLSVLQDHFLKPLWSFEMWSGVGKVLDNWRYLNCLPQPFSTQVSTTVVPLPELRLWLQLVSSSEDVTHYLKKTLLLSLPVCWGSWRFCLLHSSLYLKVGEETERTRLWMKFWMFRKPPDFWLPWRQDLPVIR